MAKHGVPLYRVSESGTSFFSGFVIPNLTRDWHLSQNKLGMNTLPRIKTVVPMDGYRLSVLFDDGKKVVYDVAEDIDTITAFGDLKTVEGL